MMILLDERFEIVGTLPNEFDNFTNDILFCTSSFSFEVGRAAFFGPIFNEPPPADTLIIFY